MRLRLLSIVAPFTLALTACSDGGVQAPRVRISGPDTTAGAIWAYLVAERYEESWQTWPGKGTFYASQEPHGLLLTTYLNSGALNAVTSGAGSMPAGAIIVKENYTSDSTLAATTIMYKVPGYDPANNDWYWVKRSASGAFDAAGRVAMCMQCHAARRSNDFIFTGSLRP